MQSAALVANLKQEVAEANDTLSKQLEKTAQRMVVEAAEVQNFNEVIRILNEQNAEVQHTRYFKKITASASSK